MFKVGNKIRVLYNDADCAGVSEGDEFTIKALEPDGEKGVVEVYGNGVFDWWFSFENIEIVEE